MNRLSVGIHLPFFMIIVMEKILQRTLSSVRRDALQINLYFDEVELCNPLGSKVKVHKLGMYT